MLICLSLFLALLIPQHPQEPPSADPPADDQGTFRIGVDVNQVFLSVTARHVDGGFSRNLTREDFHVYEDGVRQEIVNFTQEAVPVKVVLLIDSSGSTRHSQAAIRRAALRFAESLSPEDQVAIITFNFEPALILNWTNDIEKVKLALESIYAKGHTVLNDALYVTFDDLLRDVAGKKAVILLTDGIDTGSSMTFEEAVQLGIRSEAIVYVASKVDDVWAEVIAARAQGIRIPSSLNDESIVQVKRDLQRLSRLTGGRVLESQAFSSLSDVYAAVADELKNQYYLSYVPSNIVKDGKWRSVEIRVLKPGVVATTRPGYYAPSGPAAAEGR